MKKNEIVVGVCEDYTNEGLGVAKVDGFPLFVKGLLRGERAVSYTHLDVYKRQG